MQQVKDYLKKIQEISSRGNATEHTYRSALESLLEGLSEGIKATNEPKRISCGGPDFVVCHFNTPVGYVETKDIGVNLQAVLKEEQLKRYLTGLRNLILTNYLDFYWFVSGEKRFEVTIGTLQHGSIKPNKHAIEDLCQLLQSFVSIDVPLITDSKELAIRMAEVAKILNISVKTTIAKENGNGFLTDMLKAFREVLIEDLNTLTFVDMYTQTVCYGLFAARCQTQPTEEFTRENSAWKLPKTNPFLRKIFSPLAGLDINEQPFVWIVDELVGLLNRTDIEVIVKDINNRHDKEDPVVHFYETFLSKYDPLLREKRGVYYTPESIVSYIVRSVDLLIKKEFGVEHGLADSSEIKIATAQGNINTHKVLILDPAVGTGTFLYEVIKHIYKSFKDIEGAWSSYVSKHLLPRIFGLELLMAPYAIAHMKLELLLSGSGYNFKENERLGIFLTNSLQEVHDLPQASLFARHLAEEANASGKIRRDLPIMVVIGNPPYSYSSINNGKWINDLIQEYYQIDGQRLGERNLKGLKDDYVKFIRFAQWRIEQSGYGIIGLITNNGYLDNPTFRGMRYSLLKSFDDIYIVNLHGNTKRKETCPDGTKDENVFDIKLGVSISIFIKKPQKCNIQPSVNYIDIWGLRELKYDWLKDHSVSNTNWSKFIPEAPFYNFTYEEQVLKGEYSKFISIKDIFKRSSNGFTTHRDHFAVAFTRNEMMTRISELIEDSKTDTELSEEFGLDTSPDWSLSKARNQLRTSSDWEKNLIPCLYRPMDVRYCLFGNELMNRPRQKELSHVLKQNICIATGRQGQAVGKNWSLVTIGRQIADKNLFYRGGIQYFPLYLYDHASKSNLVFSGENLNRCLNLKEDFLQLVASNLKMKAVFDGMGNLTDTIGPEDVLYFIYAILHSEEYRQRYSNFLRQDYARIPLTSNYYLFSGLTNLGQELCTLHLFEKESRYTISYPSDQGDNIVTKVRYDPDTERVYINKSQYFEGVSDKIWNYNVGGYQICDKWLKWRKGRQLDYDDIVHYIKIAGAINESLNIMTKIDDIIISNGGFPL